MSAIRTRRKRPIVDRFLSKLDRSGGPSACWVWTGRVEPNGYGRFSVNNRMVWAHRAAYALLVGPIPTGHDVRHLVCDNPPCCNPAHLATGTRLQNVRDSVSKRRHAFGERQPGARLNEALVRQIREQVASGRMHRDVAAEHGVSRSLVSQVVRGERWAHV